MTDQSPKNVLFISYDGMTDPLGQSQVIPYLLGLSKAGYSIFLLSCEKKEVFEQNRDNIQLVLNTGNITWTPISYTKKPPVVSTLLDISRLVRKAKEIHMRHNIQLVHTRPGVPALVGLWMKRKLGVKFLNDIREFYADSRVEGGMWDTGNPLYKSIYNYFKRKENQAVAESDGIVCLTYAAENIIKNWKEFKKGTPLEVIPCSADLQLFDATNINIEEKTSIENELNIQPTDLIVSYLGSIGGWYLTDEMMQFCKVLIEKMPAVKLLFISPHRHDAIRAAASKYGIAAEKILIRKAVRQQVPLLLSLSQYSIFFIKPCYSKQSSSPTKHGEIMAMGIPLITNSGVGDVQSIVEKYQSGIVIQEFTAENYKNAVAEISAGKQFDSNHIRQGAKEFYSLESAVSKYISIYNSIFKQ